MEVGERDESQADSALAAALLATWISSALNFSCCRAGNPASKELLILASRSLCQRRGEQESDHVFDVLELQFYGGSLIYARMRLNAV